MLETVVTTLRNDPVIAGLLPQDPDLGVPAVYTQWAPTSRQPYLVVTYMETAVAQTSGAVSTGQLDINCWDAGSSVARLQSIAHRVEDLLDHTEHVTARGHTRIKLQTSGIIPEPEPDASRWRMVFGTRLLRSATIEARVTRPQALSLVNINTATAAQLQELPRIGGSTADAIVQFRVSNGNFATTGDVLQVNEVGPKTYDAIKGLITV